MRFLFRLFRFLRNVARYKILQRVTGLKLHLLFYSQNPIFLLHNFDAMASTASWAVLVGFEPLDPVSSVATVTAPRTYTGQTLKINIKSHNRDAQTNLYCEIKITKFLSSY